MSQRGANGEIKAQMKLCVGKVKMKSNDNKFNMRLLGKEHLNLDGTPFPGKANMRLQGNENTRLDGSTGKTESRRVAKTEKYYRSWKR